MSQQSVNVGTVPNDSTGDTIRAAFQKVNSNFTEIYAGTAFSSLTVTTINGLAITTTTGGTLTVSNNKTLTVNNSLTLAGTDSATITFQGTDTYVGRATTDTLTNKTLTSPTINGGTHTGITSLGVRSTGTGAFDLTLANTENLTAGRTLTIKVNDAARTIDLGGSITTAAAFATSGANSLTLTTTGTTNVTLPTTGTLATIAGAETLTNKTLTSPTINSATVSGGTINNTAIGGLTPAAGAFTTLTSNGATTFTAGTASTSTTTGTVVITGGFGVSGAAYVGGNITTGGIFRGSSGTYFNPNGADNNQFIDVESGGTNYWRVCSYSGGLKIYDTNTAAVKITLGTTGSITVIGSYFTTASGAGYFLTDSNVGMTYISAESAVKLYNYGTSSKFVFRDSQNSVDRITFTGAGAGTFTSTVTATNYLNAVSGTYGFLDANTGMSQSGNDVRFLTYGLTHNWVFRDSQNGVDRVTISGAGVITTTSTASATSTSSGSIITSGGIGVAGTIFAGGLVTISIAGTNNKLLLTGGTSQNGATFDAAASGSAFYLYSHSGGFSIYDNTNSAARISIDNTGVVTMPANITSSSSTTGTLVVTGGAGISGALNVGGAANVTGNFTAASTRHALGSTTVDTGDLGATFSLLNIHSTGYSSINLTTASTTSLADIGSLVFGTRGASTKKSGAIIGAVLNGSATTNAAADMTFWTNPGSAGVTERMRIDKDGKITMLAGTASSSTTTGTLVVTGGVGISGATWHGGLINVAGAATLQSTLDVTGAVVGSSTARFTKLGLGMAPTNILDITENKDGVTTMKVLNNHTGTSAQVLLQCNNGTNALAFGIAGTNYGGFNGYVANRSIIDGGAGLMLASFSENLYFSAGDSYNEQARFINPGYLLLGYTSSNGSYRLQVNSQIFATNSTITTSDLKVKNLIQGVLTPELLKDIFALSTIWYTRKDQPESGARAGYGAQIWRDIFEKHSLNNGIVTYHKDIDIYTLDESSTHSLKIAAVEYYVDCHEKRIAELEAEVAELKRT